MFEKELPDLLLKLQCLRVLKLSACAIRELPDSVSKLIHLRYLDLSFNRNIEKLPDAVCCLYNLQTLLLTGCVDLAQLPTGLGRLIHLRHVDFRDTKLAKIPSEMCKLKDLQRFPLDKFVLDNESNIEDLKELQELHGKLHISGLDNIAHAGDALGANMREKKYLTKLVLEWGGDTDDSRKDHDQEVLNNLRPHTNIRKVTISGYGGTNFPAWLGDDCFSDCKNLRSLPEEMRTLLPSLQSIEISFCPELQTFPEGGLPFKLESLWTIAFWTIALSPLE